MREQLKLWDSQREREKKRENFPEKGLNLRHYWPLTEQRAEQIPEDS